MVSDDRYPIDTDCLLLPNPTGTTHQVISIWVTQDYLYVQYPTRTQNMGYEYQIESGLFLDRHVSLIVHRSHMCIFACRVRLGADAGCDPYCIARGGAGGGTYEARAPPPPPPAHLRRSPFGTSRVEHIPSSSSASSPTSQRSITPVVRTRGWELGTRGGAACGWLVGPALDAY